MKFLLLELICIILMVFVEPLIGNDWEQVFKAGALDHSTGQPIRGTEIVHLVAHKGRLYAGNGYWMDTRGYANTPWSQVIVLDSRDSQWRVDLALGPGHVRVTALKSVTFTTDANGGRLSEPVNLLLAASDIQAGKRESNIWTRNDENNTWVKTTLVAGDQYRRSTRAFLVHGDRQTGVDRIFVAAGDFGIFSGIYDSNFFPALDTAWVFRAHPSLRYFVSIHETLAARLLWHMSCSSLSSGTTRDAVGAYRTQR